MERLKSHEPFDPKVLADLEIQSIKYEFQDNQSAKFDCEVKQNQFLYGINEISAYHATISKNKIRNEKLTDNERRNARVDFFQTISIASGLGFDPYEAALVNEKLDIAKAEKDEEKIIESLTKIFSVVYKKPTAVFLEPSRLLIDFTNEVYQEIASAMMRSPSFIIGLENVARAEMENNMDFEKLQKSSIKRWESLKKAIES